MRKRSSNTRSQRGITLLEILVVLAIIGVVLGVVVGPRVWNALFSSERKAAYMKGKQFDTAYGRWLTEAAQDGTRCPDSIQALQKYSGVSKDDVKDPWGQDYIMRCPVSDEIPFGVLSKGKDMKEGTEDDIPSWGSTPKN